MELNHAFCRSNQVRLTHLFKWYVESSTKKVKEKYYDTQSISQSVQCREYVCRNNSNYQLAEFFKNTGESRDKTKKV